MRVRDQRFSSVSSLASALALALLAGGPLGGCHSAARVDTSTTQRQGRSAIDALRARAAAERARPTPTAIDPGLFPTLDVSAVTPLSESELASDAPARLTLDDIISAAPALAHPSSAEDLPSEDARLTAQLRYSQGRQKLLDGDTAEAITDLQAATRLDPSAAELWRELGNAQYASGRRTSASSSFRRAVELGLREPQVLYTLARDSVRAENAEAAKSLLIEALKSGQSNVDPAVSLVLHAELAPLLARNGHYTAAREALMRAADLPESFTSPTNMRSELAELYRKRGEAWQQIGDWSSRLADADGALDAYAKAALFPGADPEALATRRLYALLSAGRPAEASLLLLDQAQRTDQCAGEGSISLARQLSATTNLGPQLAEAISQLSNNASLSLTATQHLALARVESALQSEEAAWQTRVRALALDTDVNPVMHDLVGSLSRDVNVRARVAADIADAAPRSASILADALVLDGIGLDAFVFLPTRGAGTTIAQGYVLAKRGRAGEALDRLLSVTSWDDAARTPAQLAKVEFAAASARWEAMESALQSLELETSPEGLLSHVATLRATQQPSRALDILTRSQVEDKSAAAALLRADLALRLSKPEDAASAFAQVLEADRFDERAYEGLITLHLPTGPLPDSDKLNGTLRALREAMPQGRVSRFLSIRNSLARGAKEQVETTLMGMVRQSPPNAIALELLTGLWEAPQRDAKAAFAKPIQFLREQVDRHPDSSQVLASLARVLAASGNGVEAEALLEQALSKSPNATLARLREQLVRVALKDPNRADQLANQRLAQSAPTIDNLVERADLDARRGDLPGAARMLAAGLPRDITLSSEQSALLLNILTKTPLDAKTSVENASALIQLFDHMGEAKLLPVLQIKRLTAATIAYAAEPTKLADEVVRLAKAQPDIGLTAHRPVLQILESLGARSAMVPFLHELVARTQNDWREDIAESYTFAIMLAGDEKSTEALLGLATDRPSLVRWLAVLRKRVREREPLDASTTDAYLRAEIAYQLASGMSQAGRERESEATLALAIHLDEKHPMANNDLGYNLADRGDRLDEAEKMLDRALEHEPSNANVLDSVAWLRYKRGQLRDEVGADGAVTREGAISILRRAIELDEEGDNSIMRDHLGDALWRDGQREQATELWREASAMIAPTLAILADRKDDPSLTAKLIRQVAESLRAKLAAVQANGEPNIAPLAGERRAPPPVPATDDPKFAPK